MQKIYGVSSSDHLMRKLSKRWITQRSDISALSVGNSLHVEPSPNFSLIQPNILSLPDPFWSARFPWLTRSNIHKAHYLHPVLMRSNVVGCIDECKMMVVIHTDSPCAMTSSSMTRMSSLRETLSVNSIFSLDCTFSLIHKRQEDIVLITCESTLFGVWTVCVARITLAHTLKNYHFLLYSQ